MTQTQPIEAPPENVDAQEEWLLANVQNRDVPFPSFAAVLNRLHAAGQADRAESGADLLYETIVARRDEAALLKLLGLRAAWHNGDRPYTATCAGQLISFFQKDQDVLKLISHAGFNKNLPAVECLRRLHILRRLQPGALCYEKTWGFGTVAELDAYANQVVIDFEKKKAHRMALAYAAETLAMLDEDHLLARRHRDAKVFAEWLENDPSGVVICALRSFGPMTAPQLQETISGLLPSAESWKKFWETARKKLKQNPLVEFPSQRAAPLRLLETEISYDAAWLKKLQNERDFNKILSLVEDMQEGLPVEARNQDMLKIVENRLAFVILGANKLNWGEAAQAAVLGHELNVAWSSLNFDAYVAQFLQRTVFLDTLRELPARKLQSFLVFAHAIGGESAPGMFAGLLQEMALTALGETIEYLNSIGQMPKAIEAMRNLAGIGQASCEMVYWLCRHVETAETNGIGTAGSLAMEALAVLEAREAAGDRLKAKHQLRALFEQPAWLKTALDSMNVEQRTDFMRRMKNSSAWAAVDLRAIMARILKLYPDLSVVLQEDAAAAPVAATRFTSLRSYRERQALLTKIITQDIPKNSNDIAVARSYGDLRENFEYKSAKETQGILMLRRAELENQLAIVKSTDFENFPIAVAGPGTRVTLRHADGKQNIYYILGEWDSDETRGIISAPSKLGEAICGHRRGESVTIPSETGEIACTLMEVSSLPPEIKAWVKGEG